MSRLPADSIVLVTGANGYLASHIIDQLLIAGFRVRGTVRNVSKAQWLKEYVESTYGPDRFEVAVVSDFSAQGAFDQAVKGVSAFIHTATDLSFAAEPEKVIPIVVRGVELALQAAQSQSSIKHFIYTSSSAVVSFASTDEVVTIDQTTWNDMTLTAAYESGPMQGLFVYAASKLKAERAVWDFVKSQQPHFTVNSVIPNLIMGRIIAPGKSQASSGTFMPLIYEKGLDDGLGIYKNIMSPQHHIDVQDCARFHVAPLLDLTIKNQRIIAINEAFTWNKCLSILRKLRPNHKLQDDDPEFNKEDLVTVKPAEYLYSEKILCTVFNRPGFTSLEETIANNIEHLK